MQAKFKNVFKFFVVLAISVVPSVAWADPDSPIAQVPNAGTLQRFNTQTLPRLNAPTLVWADPAPAIVLETDWGRVEITLSSPGEVETMFFDRGDFNNPELQAKLDLAQVGALKQKLGGSDVDVRISSDKHHATLKNGQQVYWGMWIKDGAIGRVDAVTIVMKTVPQWGYPDIVRNGFEIAYTEPIGTGVGVGNTDIRTDSTFGKSFQVFNLPAARVTYFSFKARVCSGGVETKFTPHFFKGPSITGVTPDNVTCCCHDSHELLLPVPCERLLKYPCFVQCFRKKLACRVKQATEKIATAPCVDPQATVELTITGDHLPKISLAEAQEHVKITPVNCPAVADEFRILEVVASTRDTLTLKVEIVKCNPGIHQIAIDGVGGIATFTTNKVITVAPDALVREKVIGARRIVGSMESLPVGMTADGSIVKFPCEPWQKFNITPVTVTSAQEVTSCTTGNCNNAWTWGYTALLPQDTFFDGTVSGKRSCRTDVKGYDIDLIGYPLKIESDDWSKIFEKTDIPRVPLSDKKEDIAPWDDFHDGDNDTAGNAKSMETDPGLYVGINADDDNGNWVRDMDEGNDAVRKEDDLQLVILKVVNARPDMRIRLSILRSHLYAGDIRIWENPEKGPSKPLLDDTFVTLSVQEINELFGKPGERVKELWIEGTLLSRVPRSMTLNAELYHSLDPRQKRVDAITMTVIGPAVHTTSSVDPQYRTARVTRIAADAQLLAVPSTIATRDGAFYAYVCSPEYTTPPTLLDGDKASVDIFSFDERNRYWQNGKNGGFTGKFEDFAKSSQPAVVARMVAGTQQEFVTSRDGKVYMVDNPALYLEGGADHANTVVGSDRGKMIVRLWRDLDPRSGIMPPGWMARWDDEPAPVRMVLRRNYPAIPNVSPGDDRINAERVLVRNIDDDDLKDGEDLDQIGPIQAVAGTDGSEDENNLGKLEIILSDRLKQAGGTVKVEWQRVPFPTSEMKIKIWKDAYKTPKSVNANLGEMTFDGTDNVFPVNDVPTLYVEGYKWSQVMNDIRLVASYQETDSPIGPAAQMGLTVLYVEMSIRVGADKELSSDNDARDTIRLDKSPHNFNLGRIRMNDNRIGLAIEYVGTVHPSDYNQKIIMDREADGGGFISTDGSQIRFQPSIHFGSPPPVKLHRPVGNDPSAEFHRDEDPQSGTSRGKIYGFDAPGPVMRERIPPGEQIVYQRGNFKAFARVGELTGGARTSGQGTIPIARWVERCSDIKFTYIAIAEKYLRRGDGYFSAVQGGYEIRSVSGTTVTTTGQRFAGKNLQDYTVYFMKGLTGPQTSRVVDGNTANTFTVARPFAVDKTPDNTWWYIMIELNAFETIHEYDDNGDNTIGETTKDRPLIISLDLR